jgi:type IX secretion system PorP/SprF family membrane protein
LSPLNINPAYTGIIEGDWRWINNFRTQGYYFTQPVNTISLSYDRPYYIYYTQLGVGFTYTYDALPGITIPSHNFHLSVADLVQVGELSYLGFGMQIGYVYKSRSYNKLTFPSQYDRDIGGFNMALSNNENLSNGARGYSDYLDINVGFLWNYVVDKYELSTGFAAYHINQPHDYFLQEESQPVPRLKVRSNAHVSVKCPFDNGVFLLPQAYLSFVNKASEFVLGSNVGFTPNTGNPQYKNISIGAYVREGVQRNFDSFIFLVGFNYNNWITFASFDFDISGLKTEKVFSNAFELSVIYERPSTILKKKSVPCIRY